MKIEEMVELYKVLADQTRLRIVLELLNNEELCACKLLEIVDCQQPTLSHHMKLLVDSELVNARKDWKWTHYSINNEKVIEISNFLNRSEQ